MNPGDRAGTGRFSDDDRFSIAEAARSAERANRPMGALLAAGALMAGAVVYLLSGLGASGAAAGRVQGERRSLERVKLLAIELETRRRQQAAGPDVTGVCEPDPTLLSKIRAEGLAVGLDIPPLPVESRREKDGLTRRSVNYSAPNNQIVDQDLEKLLQFVQRATTIDCLEVQSLTIKPQPGVSRWAMDVEFVRVERAAVAPTSAAPPAGPAGAGAGAGTRPQGAQRPRGGT